MKVSDYIVSFLAQKGITDVFGYPGGMVTHLMDSFSKYSDKISAHVNYHEQAAAFAACGYAQISLKSGVAYATSGPGATNLITGICNAYFDSIPTIFITGQVNTYEGKGDLPVKQKGFQEMDVCAVVSHIVKYCAYVDNAADIRFYLEKAFYIATSGVCGPVVLDIPMNIQRAEIEPNKLKTFITDEVSFCEVQSAIDVINQSLKNAKRPCILVGNGIHSSGTEEHFRQWIEEIEVPVVSSMLAIDLLPNSKFYYGFIGAYGSRYANFILAKSDLIISLGSRMDVRQTGVNKNNFAVNAKLVRIDIDINSFSNKIKENEIDLHIDLRNLFPPLLVSKCQKEDYAFAFSSWTSVCNEIKSKLTGLDERNPNHMVRNISNLIDGDSLITTDVGQNQVWVAQSFAVRGQRVLFSGGHGAMGYSLPAAIGAYYASHKKVFAFMGDGGLQINLQELQFISSNKLPIKIILLNNSSLGMIRHFQEMYFEANYTQTINKGGYTVPNFSAIATAYEMSYLKIFDINDSNTLDLKVLIDNDYPAFIEVNLENDTYVLPKLAQGKLNQDQEPELDRELFNYCMAL